jgi:hypothetical protein
MGINGQGIKTMKNLYHFDVKWFPIEELSVAGSEGSLKSSGKQLLKAFFGAVKSPLYTDLSIS